MAKLTRREGIEEYKMRFSLYEIFVSVYDRSGFRYTSRIGQVQGSIPRTR